MGFSGVIKVQIGEKSRSVYTRLKALKELFSLMAFIRVLMVVNVVETSPFDILIFDTYDFRLLILLTTYTTYNLWCKNSLNKNHTLRFRTILS